MASDASKVRERLQAIELTCEHPIRCSPHELYSLQSQRLRDAEDEAQLAHAISENFAFNVKVAREINEARAETARLRKLLAEACGIAARLSIADRVPSRASSDRTDIRIAAIRAEGGVE